MNRFNSVAVTCLFTLLCSCSLIDNDSGLPVNEDIWVNGYLASWHHNPDTELINSGLLSTEEIDWSGLTHLTYFSLSISEEGEPEQSMDPKVRENFNTDRLEAIVPAAHEHGVRILFSVGGAGNYENFRSSIGEENRERFNQTLAGLIVDYGFDGVNLNMLPIETGDFRIYTDFVEQFSTVLDTVQTSAGVRPLLTVNLLRSEQEMALYGQLEQHFDQIHLLTYSMVQPWRAWQAWHQSALYNHREVIEDGGGGNQLFPSVQKFVQMAVARGIPRAKLSIAIDFYGSVWNGVNLKGKWPSWPAEEMSIMERKGYQELDETYRLNDYQWDDHSKVPYLNIGEPRQYISFENSRSVEMKVQFAEKERLGGVMLWDIGGGYLDDELLGRGHPLLRAVHESTYQYRNR